MGRVPARQPECPGTAATKEQELAERGGARILPASAQTTALHGPGEWAQQRQLTLHSGDADGERASQSRHAAENRESDIDFGYPSPDDGGGERRGRGRHLLEQGTRLEAVVALLRGQRRRDDLPGVGTRADVRRPPRPFRSGLLHRWVQGVGHRILGRRRKDFHYQNER